MEVMEQLQQSFYDAVGGADTFHAIVSRFYELVAEDEILRRVYPQDDLAGAEERLRMFLEQYWGGPRTYSDQRGHTRLRMRHAPFRVGPAERDAWLSHMRVAVDSSSTPSRRWVNSISGTVSSRWSGRTAMRCSSGARPTSVRCAPISPSSSRA